MGLTKLANFIYQKRTEFEEAVKKEAKKLRLQDITKEIKINPRDFQEKFEEGQTLRIYLSQQNYEISLNIEELVLWGNYGIKLRSFSGNRVKKLYNNFSTEILKSKNEASDNLPF